MRMLSILIRSCAAHMSYRCVYAVCVAVFIGILLVPSFLYAQSDIDTQRIALSVQKLEVEENTLRASVVLTNNAGKTLNNVMLSWTLEEDAQLNGEQFVQGATIALGNVAEENGKTYFSALPEEEIVRSLLISLPAATRVPEHRLTIELVDVGGNTLAAATKQIVLAGGGGLLAFDPQFCVLRTGTTPHVSPPILFPNESVAVFCRITNPFDEAITVIPMLRAGESPMYRTGAPVLEARANPITIPARASTVADIEFSSLPAYPQRYDAVFFLTDFAGAQRSPMQRFSWAVQGASATLRRAAFDKDGYRKGEEATLSLVFTQSADVTLAADTDAEVRAAKPLRWRGTPLEEPRVSAEVKDGDGRACGRAEIALFSAEKETLTAELRVLMERNCVDPEATIVFSEQNTVLSATAFRSRSGAATIAALQSNTRWYALAGTLALLAGILISVYFRRKNNRSKPDGFQDQDTATKPLSDANTPPLPQAENTNPFIRQGMSKLAVLLALGVLSSGLLVGTITAQAALTPEQHAALVQELNARLRSTQEILATPPPVLSSFRAVFTGRPAQGASQSIGRSGETIQISWQAEHADSLTVTPVCETSRGNPNTIQVIIDGVNLCGAGNAVVRQIDADTGGFLGSAINLSDKTSPITAIVANRTNDALKFGFYFNGANRRGVVAGMTRILVAPGPDAPPAPAGETAPSGEEAPAPERPLLESISVSRSVLYPDARPENTLRLSWTAAPEAEIGFVYGCRSNDPKGYLFIADAEGNYDERRPVSCGSVQWVTADEVYLAAANPRASARIRFNIHVYARAPGRETARRATHDLFVNPSGIVPLSPSAERSAGALLGDVSVRAGDRNASVIRLTWQTLNPDAQIAISYATPESETAYLVIVDPQGKYDTLARIPPFPAPPHALEGALAIFRKQGFIELAGVNKTDRPMQMQLVVRASIPGKVEEKPVDIMVQPGATDGAGQQQAIPRTLTPEDLTRQNEPLLAEITQDKNRLAGTGSDAVLIRWQAGQQAFVTLRYECAGAEGIALRMQNAATLFACGTEQRVTSPLNIVALNNTPADAVVRLRLRAERFGAAQNAEIPITITPAAIGTTAEGRALAAPPLLTNVRVRPRGILGNNAETAVLEWNADAEADVSAEYSCMSGAYLVEGTSGGQIKCGEPPHQLPKGTVSIPLKAVSENRTDQTTTLTVHARKNGETSNGIVRQFIVFAQTAQDQPSRQVSVKIKDNKHTIDGTGADLFTLLFERSSEATLQARYACPAANANPGVETYLQAQGGGRIPCNSLLRLPPETKELTLSVVHTGASQTAIGLEFIFTDLYGRTLAHPTIPITIRPQQLAAPQTRDALVSGLSRREIAGDGTQTTILSWIKPQSRNMYVRYDMPDNDCRDRNVFLFVAEPGGGRDNPKIACGRDYLPHESKNSLSLGAMNTGAQDAKVTVRLLSKEIFPPYAEKGSATYHLTVTPQGASPEPRVETQGVSITANAGPQTVRGNNSDPIKLTWDTPAAGYALAAQYKALGTDPDANNAYLRPRAGGGKIPPKTAFALCSKTACASNEPASPFMLTAVNTTSSDAQIEIEFLLYDAARIVVANKSVVINVEPIRSDQQAQGNAGVSLSASVVRGDGNESFTLTWGAVSDGFTVAAQYLCPEERYKNMLYLLPAAQGGGKILCGNPISLSGASIDLAAINTSAQDHTVSIILTMRNRNGEEFRYPFTVAVRPRRAGASEPMISGLTDLEIAGDGVASTRLFWKNKPQRAIYARYDCSPNAHLIVTGTEKDRVILCESDIELTSGEAIDLSAVNNSNATVSFTISLLLKNPSAANAIVGSATYRLDVLPAESPASSETRSEAQAGTLRATLDKPSIIGSTAESARLSWENKAGERVYANYKCSVPTAYLVTVADGNRVRIPTNTDIPLSEAADASTELFGWNFNTGDAARCDITLSRINLSTRVPSSRATLALELKPVSSGKQQTTNSGQQATTKQQTTTAATSTGATGEAAIVLPLLANVKITSQQLEGNGRASTTLSWSARPGASVNVSYDCMRNAYLIVAGTARDATIPCGAAFQLSINALSLSAVNNASSTATTTISIIAEDPVRGERKGARIPLLVLPDRSIGAGAYFSRMMAALISFFLR